MVGKATLFRAIARLNGAAVKSARHNNMDLTLHFSVPYHDCLLEFISFTGSIVYFDDLVPGEIKDADIVVYVVSCRPDHHPMDLEFFEMYTEIAVSLGKSWSKIPWLFVANKTDYGNPDDAKFTKYIHDYSPFHNIKDGVKYPATLITTGDHDDRVVPAHSFKFGGRLQAAADKSNPALLYIEKQAGHGAGKPLSKTIEELTDVYSFIFYNMGLEVK